MIRGIRPIDHDFVYDSWIRSVKCPTKAVTAMTRHLIDKVIEDDKVLIYCDRDDADHILGWIAYGQIEETKLLHFLFVKKSFRGNGIGSEMLNEVYPDTVRNRDNPVFCSYWSFHMQKMDARSKWHTRFVSSLLPAFIFELMSSPEEQRVAYG
tara:strand:+ start:259 stop:717 length:459 start_codon:yes stop_codon:yes gene_type:complete